MRGTSANYRKKHVGLRRSMQKMHHICRGLGIFKSKRCDEQCGNDEARSYRRDVGSRSNLDTHTQRPNHRGTDMVQVNTSNKMTGGPSPTDKQWNTTRSPPARTFQGPVCSRISTGDTNHQKVSNGPSGNPSTLKDSHVGRSKNDKTDSQGASQNRHERGHRDCPGSVATMRDESSRRRWVVPVELIYRISGLNC